MNNGWMDGWMRQQPATMEFFFQKFISEGHGSLISPRQKKATSPSRIFSWH